MRHQNLLVKKQEKKNKTEMRENEEKKKLFNFVLCTDNQYMWSEALKSMTERVCVCAYVYVSAYVFLVL